MVGQASSANLTSIRSEVIASVALAQAVVHQARASGSSTANALALQAANDNARREIRGFVTDFYERKIFDPYLSFDSAEEEQAYRKREAERQAAIEKAVNQNTPAGTLRAADLSLEQMDDAAQFGAARSPEFVAQRATLQEGRDRLAVGVEVNAASQAAGPAKIADPIAALRAAGVTLAEDDQRAIVVAGTGTKTPERGRV